MNLNNFQTVNVAGAMRGSICIFTLPQLHVKLRGKDFKCHKNNKMYVTQK